MVNNFGAVVTSEEGGAGGALAVIKSLFLN